MNESTDQDCIRLLGEIHNRLRILAVRLGVPGSECEDCVQEAWLGLLLGHPDWALGEAATQAWLRGVARRKAIDDHRRRHRHPVQSLEDVGDLTAPCPDGIDDDEDMGQSSPDETEIRDALNELKPTNREIVILHAREGHDYAQIGAILDLTPDQVRDRYCRARKQIQNNVQATRDARKMGGGGDFGSKGRWG